MLLINNHKNEHFKDYIPQYLNNKSVEYLIEFGAKNQSVFFKGETGDRYSIYVFTKVAKNKVEVFKVYNQYDHGTQEGARIATIRGRVIEYNSLHNDYSNSWFYRTTAKDVKQLMRQGVCSRKHIMKIRFCRSAYFLEVKDHNISLTPWNGMKIDLETGKVVQKTPKHAIRQYNKAKEQDKVQRKRNYIANKENTAALKRYKEAGGDTELARGWRVDEAEMALNMAQMDWSKIPIEDVFRHRNATLRSNIIEHYGMNAIIEKLDYDVVDKDTIDGRYYRLLDVTIPDFSDTSLADNTYKGLYLEMINPSTGESHFEGVPNVTGAQWGNRLDDATVKAALTWRDGDSIVQNGSTWINADGSGNSDNYVVPVVLK